LEDRAVPAVLNVTTALDEVNPNDGLMSLREAVLQANASNGADTIVMPAGTYVLGDAGELAITDSNTTINGAGAGATVIDGGGAHRIFHVMNAKQVTLSNMTIQGGSGSLGDDPYFLGNVGGGVWSEHSTLTIDQCTVSCNSVQDGFGSPGFGGGIGAWSGALLVSGSTVTGNCI
jgi:hypothetical protein